MNRSLEFMYTFEYSVKSSRVHPWGGILRKKVQGVVDSWHFNFAVHKLSHDMYFCMISSVKVKKLNMIFGKQPVTGFLQCSFDFTYELRTCVSRKRVDGAYQGSSKSFSLLFTSDFYGPAPGFGWLLRSQLMCRPILSFWFKSTVILFLCYHSMSFPFIKLNCVTTTSRLFHFFTRIHSYVKHW